MRAGWHHINPNANCFSQQDRQQKFEEAAEKKFDDHDSALRDVFERIAKLQGSAEEWVES